MNHGKEHYHAATHGKKVHEQTADTKNHPQHQIEENQEPRSGFQLGQVNLKLPVLLLTDLSRRNYLGSNGFGK